MKSMNVENVLVDEANHRTYVVMAPRIMTDGELYSAIRVGLMKHKRPYVKGEKIVFSISKLP